MYPSIRRDFEAAFARERPSQVCRRRTGHLHGVSERWEWTAKYHWLSVQIIYVENPFNDDVLAIELVKVLDSQRGGAGPAGAAAAGCPGIGQGC